MPSKWLRSGQSSSTVIWGGSAGYNRTSTEARAIGDGGGHGWTETKLTVNTSDHPDSELQPDSNTKKISDSAHAAAVGLELPPIVGPAWPPVVGVRLLHLQSNSSLIVEVRNAICSAM